MSQTPGLDLTLHPASGADSHVYANEAYRWVEIIAGTIPAIGFRTNTPPGSPSEGDTYIVGLAPTGDWSSHAEELATYLNGAWDFKAPKAGMRIMISTASASIGKGDFAVYNGDHWRINNLTSLAAPTVNDDETLAFRVGSLWIDVVADKAYLCVDATTGAAVWKDLTGAGGGGSGDPDQDIWYTMTGDAGVPMSPSSTATPLAVSGGVGIGTVTGGNVLQIFGITADADTEGIIHPPMWLSLRLTELYARGVLVDFEEVSAEPGSPSEGDAYFLPASPTGVNWAGNGGTIAYYRDSRWLFVPPTDGVRMTVSASASSFLAGCLIAYSEAEGLWYPVQELETETLHWTGRYHSGKKVYARHFSGPALGSGGSALNTAHGIADIDLATYAVARGWMGRSSIATAMPQNFSGIVVECRITSVNVAIQSAANLSSWAWNVRLECCRTPEP